MTDYINRDEELRQVLNMTDEQIDEILNREIDEDYEGVKELFDGDCRLEVGEWFLPQSAYGGLNEAYTQTEEEEEAELREMCAFEDRYWGRLEVCLKAKNKD
jgi:hypothetical protein